MISHNKICVIDFETDGLDPNYNQPISIGAVMLDGRRLTICDGGIFYSLMSRIDDNEVEQYGLSRLSKSALDKNKITEQEIASAPSCKKVWADFVNWFRYFTPKNDEWECPILAGHNLTYDLTILKRLQHGHLRDNHIISEKLLPKTKISKMSDQELANEYKKIKTLKEPWGFGPDKFYHPFMNLDTKLFSFSWLESSRAPSSLSLDNLKLFFNLKDQEGVSAHNSLVDSLWTAEILVRFLSLQRQIFHDVQFETSGETVLPVNEIIQKTFKNSSEVEEAPF